MPAYQFTGGELVGSAIEIVPAGRAGNQAGCRILALSYRHDPRFQDPASFARLKSSLLVEAKIKQDAGSSP